MSGLLEEQGQTAPTIRRPGEGRRVGIIGAPCGFGASVAGVDLGPAAMCVAEAISIASKATAGYHVTLDVDALDPGDAPGSGTVVRGGLTYREAHLAMEKIAERGGALSLEVVEINTALDINNRTAELGVELILSALGKTIL